MSKLLISVISQQEAKLALECGADIIDLKDPAEGALGALDALVVEEIVTYIKSAGFGHREISATIGNLPMMADLICRQVELAHERGVDFIKIGFFPETGNHLLDIDSAYVECLQALKKYTVAGVKLIAVLFADFNYPQHLIALIKQAGFCGVMLDTVNKDGESVLQKITHERLLEFASEIKSSSLQFGIAGSLRFTDVETAVSYGPGYLGFRGGVCVNYQRTNRLDSELIVAVRQAMLECCKIATSFNLKALLRSSLLRSTYDTSMI